MIFGKCLWNCLGSTLLRPFPALRLNLLARLRTQFSHWEVLTFEVSLLFSYENEAPRELIVSS